MPAEIDTGGPRVLHCDYRADCPIPIVGSPSTGSESSRSHRENRQFAIALEDQTDCSQTYLPCDSCHRENDGLIESRTRAFSCGPRGQDVARSCHRYDIRKDIFEGDNKPRGRGCSRNLFDCVTRRKNCNARRNDEPNKESRCSSFTRIEIAVEEEDDRVFRDSRTRVGRSLSSSQRSRSPLLGEQSREEAASRVEGINARKVRRVCPKSRSYFQLAVLLFLVAFGQSGLHKSGVHNLSAKSSTTGLSVLAIGSVIGAVSAAPIDLTGDAGVRAERSANLSHITGASRKIQMYIKNRHLQILPDGTVNGSNDDTSDYTIFQRTSVSRGQLRIQGVATCLYLCMDSCGLLYGSREYTEDCVFNETLEQHNYNTYSSVRWSTAKKTLYLGLNRRGQPRRVQTKGHNLGRLSAYARVLTQVAPPDRVEALHRRMMGAQHNVRHRHNARGSHHHRSDVLQQQQPLCPSLPVQEKDGRDRFRCRKRKKRKKRKRKCRPGETPGPQCQVPEESGMVVGDTELRTRFEPSEGGPRNGSVVESKRSCEGAASEEACRREALSVPSKKRKLRVDESTASSSSSSTSSSRQAANGNLTSTSNGKSKAPAPGAKKLAQAGSMSQSKKPNLTDGKKRKRKGGPNLASRRRPLVKRPGAAVATANTSSAADTATTAQPSTTSCWPSRPPGAATGPSAGRGASHRRRKLPSSPRNEFDGSSPSSFNSTLPPRRAGKGLLRPPAGSTVAPRLKTPIASAGRVTTTTASTTLYPLSLEPPTTIVPETSSLDSNLSSFLDDVSRSDSSAFSASDEEMTNSTVEIGSRMMEASVEATSAPTIFRLLEDSRSVEDEVVEDEDENEEEGRLARTDNSTNTGSSLHFPLGRLAM